MKRNFSLIALLVILFSCRHMAETNRDTEKLKAEIIQTEKEFAKMAADSGLAVAFSHYVADSGVIQRRDTLLKGPVAVKKFYKSINLADVSLKWSPDFVDASLSGDLAYTYGHFKFSFKDTTGSISTRTGIFHTVWKRQKDGSWKFVWD